MTENESILSTLQNGIVCATDDITREDLEMMVKCLEELQRYRAIGTVEELQKSVKEEDVLKFYYIESEDKYVVGQRVDNFYYGEVGKTGLAFYMSRYLPWGEHVVAPDTLWKEHTYPSKPKEIPFFDWLQGFMKKEYKVSEMPTGWIPCSERLPEVNGWYLVTNELGVVQQQYWGASHWQKLRDDAVKAWMPLPAPFKEGE